MRFLKTKQKLTLLFTLYFFLFLLAMGVLFISAFRFIYTSSLKRDLTHEFKEVVTDHIGIDRKGVFFKKDKKGDTLRLHLFNDGVSALFFDAGGNITRKYGTFESSQQQAQDLKNISRHIRNAAVLNKVFEVQLKWNGVSYISLVSPLRFEGNTAGAMILAKSLSEVESVTNSVILVLAMLGGLGLLGSFALGYLFTQSALQPVGRIIKAIEETTLQRLEKKAVVEGHPDDEFVLLADKFNEMLSRLHDMAKRQKEFIANASHELKTPLTRAVSSLDLLLASGNMKKSDIVQIKDDLLQINELIERLLVLGKVQESSLPRGKSSTKAVINKVLDSYTLELKEREIRILPDKNTDLDMPIPREYAQIIFSNLISNAIKYSPSRSPIEISIDVEKKTISIGNKGDGLTGEEAGQMFGRFFRSAKARRTTHGYGLGLNLVKQICDEYHVDISLVAEKESGILVTLRCP